MNKKNKLVLIVLLTLTFSGFFYTIPFAETYSGKKIAEYMSSPLPSAPEPVLKGGDFPVIVKDLSPELEGGEVTAWSGIISSMYGKYDLPLVNGTYDGEKWLIYFHVPNDVNIGLYNLTLTQGSEKVHQSRCVWVLNEWPKSLIISHITDIHEPIGELVFPAYIMQSNFINPDLFIASGDIVQTESNARAWAYLQYVMHHIEYPSYLVPGNHDYSGYGGKAYSLYGGKLNYTLKIGDFIFIALDSGERGYVQSSQLKWLENQLIKYPDKEKIISFHHSFLSSEYEDDLGKTTGGYIEVDTIDELSDAMFVAWKDEDGNPLEEAKTLFRLVQEYDIRLILTGHVHRDMIYIVNNQHYFITTSTSGGGLPPEQRYGSRLITLNNDGSILLDKYAIERLEDPPNNIPTGFVKYYYTSANDFSSTAVSAHFENMLNMSISEGRLIFKVSDTHPIESYNFIGEQPVDIATSTTEEGYVFEAYFDVDPQSGFDVTLKAEDDSIKPKIELISDEYQLENPTGVTLTFSDFGWGLKEISVSYSLDEGTTWIPVDSPIQPILIGTLYQDTFPEVEVSFVIPALFEEESILVRAEATDYAENFASYISSDLTVVTPMKFYLSLESEPIIIDMIIDDISMKTPFNETLEEGQYTISVPETVTLDEEEYKLIEWVTGETENQITINLNENKNILVLYEKIEISEPDTQPDSEPTDEPVTGIPMSTNFIILGLIIVILLMGVNRIKNPNSLLPIRFLI